MNGINVNGLEHVPDGDRAAVTRGITKWLAISSMVTRSAYALALAWVSSTIVVVCGG